MTEFDQKNDLSQGELPELMFGFAVLINAAGDLFLERNPKVFNVGVQREASLLEVRRYASELLMDINAQAAAEYVAARLDESVLKPAPVAPEAPEAEEAEEVTEDQVPEDVIHVITDAQQ